VSVSAPSGASTDAAADEPSDRIPGPTTIEQPDATVVVPQGWTAVPIGADIVLERVAK
jgi:N-methylhydantoinase A/oxoprolinase/acetone carboxylase beta subunit